MSDGHDTVFTIGELVPPENATSELNMLLTDINDELRLQ